MVVKRNYSIVQYFYLTLVQATHDSICVILRAAYSVLLCISQNKCALPPNPPICPPQRTAQLRTCANEKHHLAPRSRQQLPSVARQHGQKVSGAKGGFHMNGRGGDSTAWAQSSNGRGVMGQDEQRTSRGGAGQVAIRTGRNERQGGE